MAVVFEKEGINTLEGTGEILITILSSLAQEESRNISENIRWGVVGNLKRQGHRKLHKSSWDTPKTRDGDTVIEIRRGRDRKDDLPALSGRLQYRKDCKASGRAGNQDRHRGRDKWHSTVIDKMLRK